MTAYYNENDPFAAEWLRNLIKEGLIADGEVDDRSIIDVRPADLAGYQQCHFFAGIGGWSYALRLAGWSDDRPVWTGSCPCQPFSVAGKQKGFADDRHLWPVWHDLISECSPSVVFGEQVASATDWLGLVRGDLEAMGYAVGAIPIQAASAGADHLRDRYWFVANGDGYGLQKLRADTGRGCRCRSSQAGNDADRRSAMGDASSEGSGRHGRTVSGAQAEGAREREDAGRLTDKPEPAGIECSVVANSQIKRRSDWNGGSLQGAAEREWPAQQFERRCGDASVVDDPERALEWVIGADGKARRVKPGVRLLADGFPNRVGLLRGFGNAIDPRPAASFIKAAMI